MPPRKISKLFPYLIVLIALAVSATLVKKVLRNSEEAARVEQAKLNSAEEVRTISKSANIDYPPKRIFFRAFKTELELEVWGANSDDGPFVLLNTYAIARASGRVGPKRKEGDFQVPEGVYYIDRFNPDSSYHLSLGLNYPNASDKLRGDPDEPGTDIFIHGSNVSIGCLAMTDEKIEEIYTLALGARESGQKRITVHIFPARFGSDEWSEIRDNNRSDQGLLDFWDELEPIFDAFNATHVPPRITIANDGSYQIRPD